eukprot:484557-Amphidinium_carterae.1
MHLRAEWINQLTIAVGGGLNDYHFCEMILLLAIEANKCILDSKQDFALNMQMIEKASMQDDAQFHMTLSETKLYYFCSLLGCYSSCLGMARFPPSEVLKRHSSSEEEAPKT